MEYQVVHAGEFGPSCTPVLEKLESKVRAEIGRGWAPLGGVVLGPPDSADGKPFINLFQAMTRN